MLERLSQLGRRPLPYDMFDHQRFGLEARNAKTLERIYHKGQERIWDGREVLAGLIAKHGPPRLDDKRKQALGRLFAMIMWGELAAWKVSAALADELEPFEAKLAATSQTFDEARHFYVMHDYLTALGAMPERLDRGAETLLSAITDADHLSKKLIGMQLMIEPVALTIFQLVRRMDVEPVLTGLMPYYERDEARHVALGVKYLPAMIRQMSLRERVELWGFQMRAVTFELWGSIGLMRDLKTLGIDPRIAADTGRAKLMLEEMGVSSTLPVQLLDRYGQVLLEALIPVDDDRLRRRLRRMAHAAWRGTALIETDIEPDVAPPA